MPRDPGTGVYTLPLPPTEPRRIPVTGWANTTVEDLAAALNNIPGSAVDLVSVVRIRGAPGGSSGSSWAGFYNEDLSTRWGYVGKGSPANPDIYLAADSGRVRLLSSPADPAVGLERGQLQFPATQNPSSNANTLDDYEEGTFTPTLTFETPGNQSIVYAVRTASYTKIGDVVHFQVYVLTSTFTHTTAAGNLNITGLPFTASATPLFASVSGYGRGFIWASNFHYFQPMITGSSVLMYLVGGAIGANTSATRVTIAQHTTAVNVEIIISGTYKVA